MFDCARSLLKSSDLNVHKNSSRRRDANGMDLSGDGDEDTKDHFDPSRPDDLPAPNLPKDGPDDCFLIEWWSLFWDMFNAQRSTSGKGVGADIKNYQQFTQVSCSKFRSVWLMSGANVTQQMQRVKQEGQQQMIRNLSMGGPGGLIRQGPNGINNEIARRAMQNNKGPMYVLQSGRTEHWLTF